MKLLAFIFEQPSYSVISSIDMPGVKGQGHFYSTNTHNREVRFEADIIDFNVKSALRPFLHFFDRGFSYLAQ